MDSVYQFLIIDYESAHVSNDQHLELLAQRIAITFDNQDLLIQALTHRSYINEHPTYALGHNERLEFLGDAVLELIVTEHLYHHYPTAPEGDMTNWRASLVNAKMLSTIASDLGLENHLLMSKGEAKDKHSRARQYILANAMESLIGAIYLDKGMNGATIFIKQFVLPRFAYILEHALYIDPKSRFQELAQERIGVTPTYEVLTESGPDHDKQFVVGVYVGGECVAKGEGPSKQEAQLKAAHAALEVKQWQ